MWRFLFAGLGTAGGLALLFFSSFTDPVPTARVLRSAVPVAEAQVNGIETAPRAVAAQNMDVEAIDLNAANSLVAEIQGTVAQAPSRHAPSAARAQGGTAIHSYISRAQHQGVWLFPPNQTGGGGNQ